MSVKQQKTEETRDDHQPESQQHDLNRDEISEPENEHQDLPENETTDELDTLIEEQQKRINELEEEIEHIRDTQLRKAAEMENMRRRLQREREQIFQLSKETAVQDFLPVSDDLQRTLEAIEKDATKESSGLLDGIKLVADKFDQILEKHGVERINQTGVPFDVDLHDALLRQKPEDDSVESGTVLQVIENGYRMGEKTLRHAKVIVSE